MAGFNFTNPYARAGGGYAFGELANGGFSLLGNGAAAARGAGGFTPTANFVTNLRNPTLLSGGGAALAALPDILAGNYAQAAATGAASYTGSAAGSAAATALGFSGGPVTAAAVLGGLAATTLAKTFFKSKPQRHSAGANLQVEGGLASFQNSGQDRSNTQFVDEFINYVAQGANEVASSYGLALPDTPGRRLTGNGNPGQTVGNQYRLAVEDQSKGKGPRSISVIGPDEVRQTFTGENQAEQAYEYAVMSLLNSIPGFNERAANPNPGGGVKDGPEVITPSATFPRADEVASLGEPYPGWGNYPGRGTGPTILSLGAAPTELKPKAQQAYYRQRNKSIRDRARTRGVRTSPRGISSRASTAKTIVSGS